ncbi:hypothetical protein INR49_021306 [Caranx melampygus]|nr:hypothetical protein INR49_021306 [Caranx melampygus]
MYSDRNCDLRMFKGEVRGLDCPSRKPTAMRGLHGYNGLQREGQEAWRGQLPICFLDNIGLFDKS